MRARFPIQTLLKTDTPTSRVDEAAFLDRKPKQGLVWDSRETAVTLCTNDTNVS